MIDWLRRLKELVQEKRKGESVFDRMAGQKTTVYGGAKTIHRTGFLDVEVYDGRVVSVWFRCMPLPFRATYCDETRAKEMLRMYEDLQDVVLSHVELTDGDSSS